MSAVSEIKMNFTVFSLVTILKSPVLQEQTDEQRLSYMQDKFFPGFKIKIAKVQDQSRANMDLLKIEAGAGAIQK